MERMKRRQLFSYFAAAAAGGMVGFAAGRTQAGKPHVAPGPGGGWVDSRISVHLEHPDGSVYRDYWDGDSRYVAGELGERYNLRLYNHSAHRVETVVTVDGRDVVSGELGDFVKQRGYVIPAYGSVLIDGFRQSLSHVAAFRFAEVRDGYSARKGTPQHSGVIGVAVFDEKPPPQPRVRRPVEPTPQPYPDYRYPTWNESRRYGAAEDASPAGGASATPTHKQKRSAPRVETESNAPAQSRPSLGDADYAGSSRSRNSGSGSTSYGARPSYDPPPRDEHLGTEYGETRYSQVREVTFVRRNNNKPDALLTLYYDSESALRRRGVIVDPPPYNPPYYSEPEPFPDRRFAQPPPPRRY